MDEAVKAYSTACRFLNLNCAHLVNGNVYSTWSQEVPLTNKKVFISKIFSDVCEVNSFETTEPGIVSYNKDRSLKAHLFNRDDVSFVEVWDKDGLGHQYNLSQQKVHGLAYVNNFSSLKWSPDSSHLVYVAEIEDKKLSNHFEKFSKDPLGDKFALKESWGEQLSSCHQSVVCILNVVSGAIETIESSDATFWSLPAWYSNEELIMLGFEQQPFKHGAIYCSNRANALYKYNIPTKSHMSLTENSKAISEYSVNDANQTIAFLQCDIGGPHRDYLDLFVILPNLDVKPVFYASICGGLGSRVLGNWVDSDCILVNELDGAHATVVLYNIATKSRSVLLRDLFEDRNVSFKFIDQVESQFLFSYSSINGLNNRFQCGIGYYDVKYPKNFKFYIKGNDFQPNIEFEVRDFEREGRQYNGIYIKGKEEKDRKTLIVFPHGGPHSAFTTAFSKNVHAFASLGFSLLLVNYTGSLGLGRNSIHDLLGHVGDIDVKDVQQAAKEIFASGDFTKAVVMGGSHGGFLTAHLIGQYPEFYKAAALRNPVIDIATMVGATDIPDWNFCETGIRYNASEPPVASDEMLAKMFKKSPIIFVGNVKCPVLILLGQKDLRVPPSQGLRYYKYLKSRGADVSVKVYPNDCHPLSSVECAADCFIHMFKLFS